MICARQNVCLRFNMTAENNDSIRIPDAVVQLYWVLRVIGLFIVASCLLFFKHCGIDYRYGGEVDYVAHGGVCADEVYRLVEAHLYRALASASPISSIIL